MNSIGTTVREARLMKGWSQKQLADAIGVSQTTVDKIEQGTTRKSRYLPELFNILGLDLSGTVREPGIRSDEASLGDGGPTTSMRRPRERRAASDPTLIDVFFPKNLDERGFFVIDPKAVDKVQKPRILDNDRLAYAVYIGHDLLSPEFERGDIAFFHSHLSVDVGMTAIFHDAKQPASRRVIGRLLHVDEGEWIVGSTRNGGAVRLSRTEFPDVQRLTVRYVRGLG